MKNTERIIETGKQKSIGAIDTIIGKKKSRYRYHNGMKDTHHRIKGKRKKIEAYIDTIRDRQEGRKEGIEME